jgi:hypothetical protein
MDYRYLERMTDNTGIIQFAVLDKPNLKSGHTVDDNARALLVALNMEEKSRERLSLLYTRFLKDACNINRPHCIIFFQRLTTNPKNGSQRPEVRILKCPETALCS